MMFILFFLMLVGAMLSIYAASLFRELYLRGHHNQFGKKMSLKSLRLIITKEMSMEDKTIAVKCLKLYYGYLVVFYCSLVLIVCTVLSGIINKLPTPQ